MYVATAQAAGIAGDESVFARILASLLGQAPPECHSDGAAGNRQKAIEVVPRYPAPRLHPVSSPAGEAERITVIRAAVGNTTRMIPVRDVIFFEAGEKYVNVVTATGEALVRLSMRELMARIDSTDFIQVHRSVMVNANSIMSATRDENGHYSLNVRGVQRTLKVSRAFSHLFRPM